MFVTFPLRIQVLHNQFSIAAPRSYVMAQKRLPPEIADFRRRNTL